MKPNPGLLFAAFLGVVAAAPINAQSYIRFNNLSPANGLVYVASDIPGGLLLDQDVNFELLAGANPFSLTTIHRWLVSDGSATGINVAPGRFADPSNSVFEIPGVQPGGLANLVVLAWVGDVDRWEATGAHGIAQFANQTGTFDLAPGLTGMPSFIIGIPEPSVLVLVGFGSFLFAANRSLRRRRV